MRLTRTYKPAPCALASLLPGEHFTPSGMSQKYILTDEFLRPSARLSHKTRTAINLTTGQRFLFSFQAQVDRVK